LSIPLFCCNVCIGLSKSCVGGFSRVGKNDRDRRCCVIDGMLEKRVYGRTRRRQNESTPVHNNEGRRNISFTHHLE
jgi:hypothetical protein